MTAAIAARRVAWTQPGLSGGRLAEAVSDCVTTLWMPTEHSGASTSAASAAVAADLGTSHVVVDVSGVATELRRLAEVDAGRSLAWADPADDLVLQNLQARARGVVAWTLANRRGATLLTTSNLSEAAVGYTTMDGDTMGAIAPIAGVPKTWVSAWLRWAGATHGWTSCAAVLALPATAELRPPASGQTDEDDLMPYDVLDRIAWGFVERGETPRDLLETLWPELSRLYAGDRARLASDIRLFVRRFCTAQWKRERLAPGFRVGPYDLDPRGGWRWPVLQTAFEVELADLDRP
jgi:NAD+ synthase (glutamine-hydrolysing)